MDDFVAFGAQLRQAREDRELSLDDMERLTRIRLKYLEAMESGDFAAIDNPVQLRGFLRNYAHVVELDGDAVLANYERLLEADKGRGWRRRKEQTEPVEIDLSVPPPDYTPPQKRYATQPLTPVESTGNRVLGRTLRGLLILAGALALTAVIIGGIYTVISGATDDTEETPPPPLLEFNPDASPARPTLSPTQPGVNIAPPTQSTPDLRNADQLFIVLTAEERLWVRIQTDGVMQYEGVLPPGTGLQYSANESITVRASNAGALAIRINNQDYRLGTGREQAQQTFTREGLLSPTENPAAPAASSTSFNLDAAPSVTTTLTIRSDEAATNTSLDEASPPATLFFTSTSASSINAPSPLPSPVGSSATPSPLPSPLPPTATATLTLTTTPSPTDTLLPSRTPTVTSSPTTVVTPTQFLPPRNTSTPTPAK